MNTSARFRVAYAEHRAAEGRGSGGAAELLALPYLRQGPLARQWAIRARTYDVFLRAVVKRRADREARPLSILDLGSGNGWLCYRLAREGHHPVALDWRQDAVDGLGAARPYAAHLASMFPRVAGSFDGIPFRRGMFDLVVFNAAIHYAIHLNRTLTEAARVSVRGGIVILDSPFYARAADGERMVAAKRADAVRAFGVRAADLLALPSIEYLTAERLANASALLNLAWQRHRVRYPFWYELRPLAAKLRGQRAPSRFDVWEATAG